MEAKPAVTRAGVECPRVDGHSFAHPEQALTAGGRRGLARPGVDDLQVDVGVAVPDDDLRVATVGVFEHVGQPGRGQDTVALAQGDGFGGRNTAW